jgi:hypothetical protein
MYINKKHNLESNIYVSMYMLHINEHVEWDTNFVVIINHFNICPIYDSLYWLMNRYFSQPDAWT